MFEILKCALGRIDAYRLINRDSGEYLEVLSGLGAGINGLLIKNTSGDLVPIISGYKSEQTIQKDHHTKFYGSKLSPFPNRLYDGKYLFDNVEYQLPINDVEGNTNLHGFLHNLPFIVRNSISDERSACLKLAHEYQGTAQGYPFPYRIHIDYIFKHNELCIDTQIENTGAKAMPIGDGWHPYFQYDSIENVSLQMGNARRVHSLAGNVLGTDHGFESGKELGSMILDDCFEVSSDEQKFEVSLRDETSQTKITLWQESGIGGYRYLQIYTPPNRSQIAIEPVSCAPDAFNTKQGLIVLKPQQKMSMKMGIRFSTL